MTFQASIAWPELLKNTIVTAQHGNDGSLLALATESLQQTAQQLVTVLNERARLLANSAQFDAALRDAAAIRAILPGSGLGYLCAGDIYCQQGRYAAAISIYDQGLIAVPKSDPYQQQLRQLRTAAATSNSKRIDFINQLPLDIVVTNIIPRMMTVLFSQTLYEPFYVSRAWQKRILQQPNGLEIHFIQEENTFKRGHDQLVRFAPYVQSLSGSISRDVRLEELFSRAHFSNLKRLHLKCDDTVPRRPFINGLQLIADSLTHLTILDYPAMQLRDMLESCPNLVSLATADVDVVTPSLLSLRYPKIKHLALHDVPERVLEPDNMMDVLSRFPSLT